MEIGVFEPRQKSTTKDRCAVKGCDSRADKNLSFSFHRFPTPNSRIIYRQNIFGNYEKIDAHKAWQIALKINNITKRTKVCSKHFKKSDYFFADISCKKRFLKKNAVPSCNLPGNENKEASMQARLQRVLKRNCVSGTVNSSEMEQSEEIDQEAQEQVIHVENDVHQIHDQPQMSIQEPQESINVENEMLGETQSLVNEAENQSSTFSQFPFEKFIKPASPVTLIKDIGVQVNTDCFMLSIIKFINSDSKLNTTTGIESFKVLDTIVEIVRKVSNDKFEQLNIIMNTKDRIIMTYMKLKQNLSYTLLAVFFNCYSAKHIQRIFHETIKILSKCLKAAIPWPSRLEISKNLPKCFEGFEDVRVVLDCTEICTQHSKNLCGQVKTHSHYKSNNTCKIMTGVSPAGNITYLSKPYIGRVSDSTIFQQSSLVQLLEPGDAVMVDRGFLIDEICEKNEWKCIRPPFLKEKKQLSKEKDLLTTKVAKARVHIKRSNQRIKTFKILASVLPSTLVPLLEDIFIVVCGTINMSDLILNDSEFMNVE